MSSRFKVFTGTVATAALLSLCSPALAQSGYGQSEDADPEMRIERLENRLRQLTGQNEELQYRNRQLEERLRALEGGAQAAPGQAPNVAAMPPAQIAPSQIAPGQAAPGYRQPPSQQQAAQSAYEQPQIAAPAPIVQEQPTPGAPGTRRRGDAFDPNQNPNAPGAPRALGGGQQPMPAVTPGGGRNAGEPLDLANTSPRYQQGVPPAAQPGYPPAQSGYPAPAGGAALATLPPSATPRDEFDLGIGYMQRKDYALAEQTMKNFTQKYPSDPLLGDAQYWLGESYFQRQQYRDSAEAFLAVTTKYEKSAKAPDALLRLGQSLAALKEKEAACAAFGEIGRKYPRASASVKATVDREQKRVKC
ncbi:MULTISPECIES: tol-pal system protein YbgF [Bradyrhizobium]|uniref:tol-pal system protein YbgF n=1 Tax=Bradyrhizobium TaxID=374 RepID=UPI00155EAA22|nr:MULTISPECIES: tol-pal system protein YbgF [Bradyrhizobium]MDD1517291.1 tol-pal system protein YbgF [Bradyrhizobium sp. WBAH30]MDD1541600.1 tol-pal system protein YbgF [Bradyrhizobium sp. WBAH41]MDD1555534.1 tol-pal system protein YbgF [Bradyrhizobium sp. WBAH23]MDD1564365.1 tol-pal system protein YbgF [Bradyrhizobium sp. WBAH33]MDD1587959.1 tol-pal system protein YbgF [Bradyrhizobium sp. WBAH42]